MKVVHVLQHTSAEYLGLVEDHLEGRNIRFRYARPFAGKNPLSKAEEVRDGLIVLGGGPWGSAGTRNVPTLADEILLTKACFERQVPVVGIGLGAQILAMASGGGSQSAELEFSVGTARRAKEGALSGYLPAQYPLAIYMRDWPVPPAQAEILAVDDQDRPALWQVGEHALAFSGHPGLKVAMVEDLIMEFEETPADPSAALQRLKQAQRGIEDALVPIMAGMVKRAGWM